MSDRAELRTLLQVSQAQYDRQRQTLVKVIQEENALRSELDRLASMNETPEDENNQINNMRVVGADLLWRGWLGRAKTEVNMKLARVLAIKEYEQDKVRQAFGKISALRELLEDAEQQHRKAKSKTSLERALQHTLLAKPGVNQRRH